MNRQGSARGKGDGVQPVRKRKKINWLVLLAWLVALGLLAGAALFAAVLVYFNQQLPDFRQITEYKPALITRVFDRNGEILAEYANERRVWVPFSEIPKPVVQAFLAAEDSGFFEHGGYDLKAIVRAALVNVMTDRTQGASTITQQVAKTYLLSNERTFTRKIKELILSWRIERAFTKNEILELYLNRIYLGNGAYGVAAAAETYFNKTLAELDLGERAMIAGMPQAPSRYNPVKNPSAAKARRDIVIRRMESERFIDNAEADAAVAAPLVLNVSTLKQGEDAPHFAEFIRRLIAERYGEDALYQDGLSVYTTIDLPTQRLAEQAVYEGLRTFDRRRGWRGPLAKIKDMAQWKEQLAEIAEKYAHSSRLGEAAVVLKVSGKDGVRVGLADGREGSIAPESAKWTGKGLNSLVKMGDVVVVKASQIDKDNGKFTLEQLPQVQGALVAIDVASGEVVAMVGGLGEGEGFNRAVQAKRQVGSAFKPFVFTAALENNYTPASTVLDAPVVFKTGEKEWKPRNYDDTIGGLITLRDGLAKSRNLMTVRLAQDVGMRNVADVARRMGVSDRVPITDLSVALGTLDLGLMEMVGAYAVYPRGGEYVPPVYLRRVQDAQGVTLLRATPACEGCLAQLGAKPTEPPPVPPSSGSRALSPQVAYQMVSMMEGVVESGTAYSLKKLGVPLAGKTGTTNDFIDAWFVGFSPDIAVGVWVGYDTPRSLGTGETGAKAALPIWQQFMAGVVKNQPSGDFRVPSGIEFARIDADSGLLPGVNSKRFVTEAFVAGTVPTDVTPDMVDDPTGSFGGGGAGGGIDNLLKSFGIY